MGEKHLPIVPLMNSAHSLIIPLFLSLPQWNLNFIPKDPTYVLIAKSGGFFYVNFFLSLWNIPHHYFVVILWFLICLFDYYILLLICFFFAQKSFIFSLTISCMQTIHLYRGFCEDHGQQSNDTREARRQFSTA